MAQIFASKMKRYQRKMSTGVGRSPQVCLKALNNLIWMVAVPPVRIWSENRRGIESAEKTMLIEERVIEMIGFETKLWIVAVRK